MFYQTLQSSSPPTPFFFASLSLIMPILVDTIVNPYPPNERGMRFAGLYLRKPGFERRTMPVNTGLFSVYLSDNTSAFSTPSPATSSFSMYCSFSSKRPIASFCFECGMLTTVLCAAYPFRSLVIMSAIVSVISPFKNSLSSLPAVLLLQQARGNTTGIRQKDGCTHVVFHTTNICAFCVSRTFPTCSACLFY